nr:AMP-binding protein [Streptomyces tailanensis]
MFRSEYADAPPVELPIHDAVLGHAAEFGDLPALIDGIDGTTLTYEQVDRFHRRLAAAFADAGVRKGDVLALHSPNTIAYPTAFYAATRAGATVHPLATPGELATQLRDSGVSWIVTVSPLLDTARAAAERVGGRVITDRLNVSGSMACAAGVARRFGTVALGRRGRVGRVSPAPGGQPVPGGCQRSPAARTSVNPNPGGLESLSTEGEDAKSTASPPA